MKKTKGKELSQTPPVRKINLFGNILVVPLDTSCEVKLSSDFKVTYYSFTNEFVFRISIHIILYHSNFPERRLSLDWVELYRVTTTNSQWIKRRSANTISGLRKDTENWLSRQVKSEEIINAVLDMFIIGHATVVKLKPFLPKIKIPKK